MTSLMLSDDRYVELRASEHRQAASSRAPRVAVAWEADTQDYPSPDTVPFPKRMRIIYPASIRVRHP